MLRYIMKVRFVDALINTSWENLYTIDGNANEVEQMLKRGGHGESGMERHELVGVEVVEKGV